MVKKFQSQFDNLTAREKIILVATIVICVWGGWDTFFWSPLKRQQQLLQQELTSLDQQLSAQQQAAIQLEAGKTANPNSATKTKLAELNAELAHLQTLMAREGETFVPPRLMSKVLNDLLNQNRQLTLLKLDTLPVTTLREEKDQFFPVYKHGLELTFSGGYSDTLAYLKSLESLSWRIKWDSIDYQVKNHPLAETTIRAYTLSFEEGWLGV